MASSSRQHLRQREEDQVRVRSLFAIVGSPLPRTMTHAQVGNTVGCLALGLGRTTRPPVINVSDSEVEPELLSEDEAPTAKGKQGNYDFNCPLHYSI